MSESREQAPSFRSRTRTGDHSALPIAWDKEQSFSSSIVAILAPIATGSLPPLWSTVAC